MSEDNAALLSKMADWINMDRERGESWGGRLMSEARDALQAVLEPKPPSLPPDVAALIAEIDAAIKFAEKMAQPQTGDWRGGGMSGIVTKALQRARDALQALDKRAEKAEAERDAMAEIGEKFDRQWWNNG